MNLTPEQQDELNSRYNAARFDDTSTLSFDKAQEVRWKYFNELRVAGEAEETMSEAPAAEQMPTADVQILTFGN